MRRKDLMPLPSGGATESPARLIVRWMFIFLGFSIGVWLVVPALLALLAAFIAPSRGRRWDTGLSYGIWFGPFYIVYLAFQPHSPVSSR